MFFVVVVQVGVGAWADFGVLQTEVSLGLCLALRWCQHVRVGTPLSLWNLTLR